MGRRQQFKRPILWFLGGLVVAGLWGAFMDAQPGAFVGYAIEQMFLRLLVFVPMWLFLGGFFYVCVRMLRRKPSVLQVIFAWPLTVLMVLLVLLSGVFTYID